MMSFLRRTREVDLERLLTDGTLARDAGFEGVAGFVRHLEAAYPSEPVPAAIETAHVAAMIAAARPAAGNGDALESRRARRPRRGRLALRLAAATAAFVLLFCGLALAGTLPAPLQGFASRAASAIGVHVPRPEPTAPAGALAGPSPEASPSAQPAELRKPHPTSKPASGDASGSGQAQDQTGAQGQSGAQQQQSGDQSGEQSQAQSQDQGEAQDQGQDHGGGQQGQDQSQPQDQRQSGN